LSGFVNSTLQLDAMLMPISVMSLGAESMLY